MYVCMYVCILYECMYVCMYVSEHIYSLSELYIYSSLPFVSNFSDRVKFLLLWRDMVGVSPAESIHELNTTFSVKVIYES